MKSAHSINDQLGTFRVAALALGPFLLALCTSAFGAEAEPQSAPMIDGTWRWTFTMPDGSTCRPRLVLETEEGELTGRSSFRPGTETSITNATLTPSLSHPMGDGARRSGEGQPLQVRFQVVRERDGRPIVTTYSGVWSGRFIRGKIQSNWAGEPLTYDWEAQRAHEGAEGLWKWTASFRGRKFEARVKLEQDGEVLTGSVPGSGRGLRRIRISHGSIKNGEISFQIERGTGEAKVVTIYKGKQTGDSIKGTIETLSGGRTQEAPWDAQRPD